MKELIIKDLKSLYANNYINNAVELNKRISETNILFQNKDAFCSNMEPMYFTGNVYAKTVMVMLNPGADDKSFDFSRTKKNLYQSFDDYFEKYCIDHKNYGDKDYDRLDNFDTKQAAFLHHYKNTGINIPNEFWKETDIIKKEAKKNVLMQKLQLELIPYSSRKFSGLFDTLKNTRANLTYIKPHLTRLLDVISSKRRNHILFCSKQFYNIFRIFNEINDSNISFKLEKIQKVKIGKNNLSFNNVTISYKGKSCNAQIIHSFASQALPNAFEKMSEYGKFCFNQKIS